MSRLAANVTVLVRTRPSKTNPMNGMTARRRHWVRRTNKQNEILLTGRRPASHQPDVAPASILPQPDTHIRQAGIGIGILHWHLTQTPHPHRVDPGLTGPQLHRRIVEPGRHPPIVNPGHGYSTFSPQQHMIFPPYLQSHPSRRHDRQRDEAGSHSCSLRPETRDTCSLRMLGKYQKLRLKYLSIHQIMKETWRFLPGYSLSNPMTS